MSRRALSALLGTLLMAGAAIVALGSGTASAATYSGYVMGYFTESPTFAGADYGLHLAVSPDGLNWTPLNQNAPVVTPAQGTQGLRDPFILRKQDGTFTVLATDLKGTDWSLQNQYIHVWDSTDLRSFTNYRRVKLHSLATHSWAPEAFWDASRGQYAIIYSASNGNHDVIMVNYTTDFVNVGSPQTFFDPGYAAIDGNMTSVNGTNYLYFKNNTSGSLLGAKSSSLNPGSFTTFTGGTAHGGTEAPIVVKSLTANTWYLWGDTYTPNGVFYAWQTGDLASGTWTAVNQRAYTQPLNSKHATISPITATEMANLLTKWGKPAWNRLKSYNYPDRYVRHQSNVARVDTYPFDPYQDQQWKVVPGLADSAGVSFQSVNFPTMYLRHADYAVVLNTNDNSAAFKADATFTPVAGWADSGWTSYRSYNHPDRYLRHAGYVLRIDPITSSSAATDKQDATFRAGY
ncbi:glycoside hydrolase family 43 protein [Umezawaea sp. Da 62-37]|uniref:glycoside hydrolase family 43 protein n=1 Tax=Umezawaea sp. Da 62-37 TaxID=3075927 RepID=UPI0028F720BB|nr:glycoside hydrolase family 43 protein [Umezawaea sp. Da 62-37]WNV86037.1 glycoside hydrolase family 43 protein [Umezawaea sp. Da 62-37]